MLFLFFFAYKTNPFIEKEVDIMAYIYISRTEKLNSNYRRVEALYRNGSTFDQIAVTYGLSIMDVLDISQKIFALDQKKLEYSKRRGLPRKT